MCPLIFYGTDGFIFFKQFKAGVSVDHNKIFFKRVPVAEHPVKLCIPEAYVLIVDYGATIVYLIDIGPHTRRKTHWTGFTGRIKLTSRQIICIKFFSAVRIALISP